MTPNGEEMRVLGYLTPDPETSITTMIDRPFASSTLASLRCFGAASMPICDARCIDLYQGTHTP